MLKLRDGVVELYRKAATSLPPDVEAALRAAYESEAEGSNARAAITQYLEEITSSREGKVPLCMGSGFPVFLVKAPKGLSQKELTETLIEATRIATLKIPLSQSAVNIITNVNTGDNTGTGFPRIVFEESPNQTLTIELLLESAASDTMGRTYALPSPEIGANADFDAVEKCVIHALRNSGMKACPPYIIGVGIGGSREQVTALSKLQLRRRLQDKNPDPALAALEDRTLGAVNAIAPEGDRKVIALGVKIGAGHRQPTAYLVDVAISCWATRRAKLIW